MKIENYRICTHYNMETEVINIPKTDRYIKENVMVLRIFFRAVLRLLQINTNNIHLTSRPCYREETKQGSISRVILFGESRQLMIQEAEYMPTISPYPSGSLHIILNR